MNLCIWYTLVLTLVALSKKLKHRSGCPTMYIKDWLRKKDHTALLTSTVSLIGVACVLVKGVMFMGHCILVQLAQHSHRSGGCFAAVALLSRGVRDRATGTARRGPRIRCITTTSNRRFRSLRKLCRSVGISEDVHAPHGCDLEEVLRAQTVCFLHQANVFAILLGHTPNIAMSTAHPHRVSRAPPRGHCSTAYAADNAISKHVVLLQVSSHRSKGCLHFQALLAQNLNSQGMGGSLHGTTSNFRWHPFGRSR
jgi:hypothetical protein